MWQLHTFLPHLPLHTILTTINHAKEAHPRANKAEDAGAVPAATTKHAGEGGEEAKEGKLLPGRFCFISQMLTAMVLL